MADWRQKLLGEVGLGATAGAAGGGMPTSDETISEMMIEERRPMPDEFGRMTPVPSSDEEAVKQDFRRVLADGTVGDLRQYIEMNIGDLEFLAQTDNSIAKDLEAALRSIATGDQSRFQGPSPDQNLRTWDEAFQADQNIPQKTYQSPPASGAAFASPGGFDPYSYMESARHSPYGEMTPDVLPREEFQPFQTAPGYALGGLAKSPQTFSETMMAQNTSGGVPPGEARLLEQFNIILESGSAGQKRDFITRHMSELLSAAERDPTLVQRIMGAINSGVSQRALKEVSGNRGKLLAPPGPRGPVGKYQIYDDPSYPASPVGTNEYDAMAGMGSSFPGPSFLPIKGQTAPNFEALEEVRGPMAEFAHGGYVDRGTMAGELGRRGDLSVREAGETMYERNKRLHGYDRGGYVHDRGTMPGELHPKGSLSVRVAGESMGEYEKHREDEDDYRPVRRTLATALSPTLSRRMFG